MRNTKAKGYSNSSSKNVPLYTPKTRLNRNFINPDDKRNGENTPIKTVDFDCSDKQA